MEGLRYQSIKDKPHKVLSHTGLKVSEFETLLETFSERWRHYIEHYTMEGKIRKRKVRKIRSNGMLPTEADKLLFILYHHKNNPLQETLATAFGMEQPHANVWLKLLMPILQDSLGRQGVLPERKAERLHRVLQDVDKVLIDGSERPIQRSGDAETQREDFSGKKKTLR
jgi:Helix-turn-helix of DDE superfamily endonuclease